MTKSSHATKNWITDPLRGGIIEKVLHEIDVYGVHTAVVIICSDGRSLRIEKNDGLVVSSVVP